MEVTWDMIYNPFLEGGLIRGWYPVIQSRTGSDGGRGGTPQMRGHTMIAGEGTWGGGGGRMGEITWERGERVK